MIKLCSRCASIDDSLILTVVLVYTGNDVINEEQNVLDDDLLVCGQSACHVIQAANGLLLDTSSNSLSGSHVLRMGNELLEHLN